MKEGRGLSVRGATDVESVQDESRVLILVVDDDATKRFATRAMLSPLGFEIVEAESGLAALRRVMVQDFAVILLDVRMAGMDGFETAALLRQRQQCEMTPIIFITAHQSDEFEEADLYADGAVDFMFAPVSPGELRAKVAVFVNLFLRADRLAVEARAVKVSADRLSLLTDAAPIGIFQTDHTDRYVYTNPRWTEITGVAAESAIGQRWDTVIGELDDANPGRSVAVGGLTELHHRFTLRRPGLDPQILIVTATPIPDGGSGSLGRVGTLADITAEAGAEAAMSAARDAAVASREMEKNFVASASHELRTPATSILGWVEEVLEHDTLSEEDRGFLEIVHRNAQRLAKLVEDLLIVGEAEIGASRMQLSSTPLLALVERVMSEFSTAARQGGVRLVLDCESDSASALVDPPRLEQVLGNLLSNAVKFTGPDGEIRIGIRSHDDTTEVSVSDTGIGIDPTDVENIFGRFYRTEGAINKGVKGSGLGLAIAKGMVEAQNGRIAVTSALGEGSTFTVSLPVAPAAHR